MEYPFPPLPRVDVLPVAPAAPVDLADRVAIAVPADVVVAAAAVVAGVPAAPVAHPRVAAVIAKLNCSEE